MDGNYTNGDYKRLSIRIRRDPKNIVSEDYEMLQKLRMTYKDSMSVVYNTIDRLAHKVDDNCICTYRIKRIESIISKLLRFKDMEVQRAADIAGCRCIMGTTANAIKLYDTIKRQQDKLPFIIKGTPNNYIEFPKKDGYRSIHINVQMKAEPKKVIEIQIRSLEHHNWATLVEISDVIFNSRLKEQGDKYEPKLYEFHQILSKNDLDLTFHDYKRLAKISGHYRYLEKVCKIFSSNSIELRQRRNELKMKNLSYFLISTGTDNKPKLEGFESFDDAESNYFKWFSNNTDNSNIVLTHLNQTTFDKLSIAYSNYFLTYNSTVLRILTSISNVAVNSFNKFEFFSFKKYYNTFWYISEIWFGDKVKEVGFFNDDNNIRRSVKKKKEWSASIFNTVSYVNQIIIKMQSDFSKSPFHVIMKWQKKSIDKKLSRKIVYLRKD